MSYCLTACTSSLIFLALRFALRLFFFFFNDTATTEIYTLSLHDALPIWRRLCAFSNRSLTCGRSLMRRSSTLTFSDRKSTRLNSSHLVISYAVFCLKKKKNHLTLYPFDYSQPSYARTSGPVDQTRHVRS